MFCCFGDLWKLYRTVGKELRRFKSISDTKDEFVFEQQKRSTTLEETKKHTRRDNAIMSIEQSSVIVYEKFV